jgi:hypothetical protein
VPTTWIRWKARRPWYVRVPLAIAEGAKNLTQEQLEAAIGDERTRLPEGLARPEHWSKAECVSAPKWDPRQGRTRSLKYNHYSAVRRGPDRHRSGPATMRICAVNLAV